MYMSLSSICKCNCLSVALGLYKHCRLVYLPVVQSRHLVNNTELHTDY